MENRLFERTLARAALFGGITSIFGIIFLCKGQFDGALICFIFTALMAIIEFAMLLAVIIHDRPKGD